MTDGPPPADPHGGESDEPRPASDAPVPDRDRQPADEELDRPISSRPGDGSLSRLDAVKDERIRRWDVVTPSATLIGRAERPSDDVGETVRRLHDEQHPAMAGHSARMHRLEKARIAHALCNALSLSRWERDRVLGVVTELDLTAFGSQRAIPTVALVVIQYVVDDERRRQLGLHDREWIRDRSPDELEALYDRFESMTDDPRFEALMDQHGLDTTSVNRLDRVLQSQLEKQELHGAVFGRAPNRDPSLPTIRDRASDEGSEGAAAQGT